MDVLKEYVTLKTQNILCVLATVVQTRGATPRRAGAGMVVRHDGSICGTIGGGAVENQVTQRALKIINTTKTEFLHYELSELGMSCGGEMDIFLQPSGHQPELFIFGAGHIGRFLCGIGKNIGFHVTVVDNRSEYANREKLPLADRIFSGEYSKILTSLSFHNSGYIVIVTHGHLHDQQVLEYCARQPFLYLGMIGSKNKVRNSLEKLKNKGINQQILSKIFSPIGIDIGSQTPEEIAIAVAAELIAVKNNQQKQYYRSLRLV